MVPEEKRSQMPPEMMQQLAILKIQKQEADAKSMTAQANVMKAKAAANPQDPNTPPDPVKMAEMQVKQQELQHKQNELAFQSQSQASDVGVKQAELEAKMGEAQFKNQASILDATNRQRDRESKERMAAVGLAEKIAAIPGGAKIADKYVSKDMLDRLDSQETPIPGTAPAFTDESE
jgi:hypothetical protein